jgi:hypothetical protein
MMPFENGLFASFSHLRQFERVPMGLNPGPRNGKAFRVPHGRWNHGKSSGPRQTESDCASFVRGRR